MLTNHRCDHDDGRKTIAEIIESLLKSAGIIAGGVWVYWKFVHQREHEATMDIDLEVLFVGRQGDKWIVEITALLRNKSTARVKYEDFQLVTRYALPGDPIDDGVEKINYQLLRITGHSEAQRFGVRLTKNGLAVLIDPPVSPCVINPKFLP
jgi:hypothetical protein